MAVQLLFEKNKQKNNNFFSGSLQHFSFFLSRTIFYYNLLYFVSVKCVIWEFFSERQHHMISIYIHNTLQKFGVSEIWRFWKKASYAHQGYIYLIKNTVKTVLLWNIITLNSFLFECILKCNLVLCCKAGFSGSLLQSSASHDPSEIILICWFAAQETLLSMLIFFFFEINRSIES